MQEDLLSILALWEAEVALMQAREAIRAQEERVVRAEARLREIGEEEAQVEARTAALSAEERLLQRRLDDATTRRDRTRALIDAGRATDFLVAQRQVETAAGQAEVLEGQIYALLEEQEALAAKRVELSRSRTLAEARLREAQADRAAALPALEAELSRCEEARKKRYEAVSREDRKRYDDLRRRNLKPVAAIVHRSCEACQQAAAPQVIIEVGLEKRTHTCRGCGRWFTGASEA